MQSRKKTPFRQIFGKSSIIFYTLNSLLRSSSVSVGVLFEKSSTTVMPFCFHLYTLSKNVLFIRFYPAILVLFPLKPIIQLIIIT